MRETELDKAIEIGEGKGGGAMANRDGGRRRASGDYAAQYRNIGVKNHTLLGD